MEIEEEWGFSFARSIIRGSFSIVFSYKVKAHRHVSFFVWTVGWNKILTGDNLRLRSFDFVDWYIIASRNLVTTDIHLLHYNKMVK